VILNGTAPNLYSKQLVQHAVMLATDREVDNLAAQSNETPDATRVVASVTRQTCQAQAENNLT
jgi:hypothetical protein